MRSSDVAVINGLWVKLCIQVADDECWCCCERGGSRGGLVLERRGRGLAGWGQGLEEFVEGLPCFLPFLRGPVIVWHVCCNDSEWSFCCVECDGHESVTDGSDVFE